MNNIKLLVAIVVAAFGLSAMLVGCDEALDNGEAESCSEDADCEGDDEICVDEVCIATCENDQDCEDDDICETRPDGAGDERICQEMEFEECTEDSECNEDYEYCGDHPLDEDGPDVCREHPKGQDCTVPEDCPRADEICDTAEGQCVDPDELAYYTVLIEDKTYQEDDDRCTDTSMQWDSSGAKLMYVELRDRYEGDLLSNGIWVDYEYGENTEFGTVPDIFDGTPPDYDGQCPDEETQERKDGTTIDHTFNEESVVAIGCGGWVALQFDDEDGNVIPLDESHSIWVGEYGPVCDSQWGEDWYDVSICTDQRQTEIDFATCDPPLNDEPVTGITDHPVEVLTF